MTDNTSKHSVHDALGRTRGRIEDLQLKNATLKKINNPSDDPVGNAKIMDIRTQTTINQQFEFNGRNAKDRLNTTEAAIQEVTDALIRAKEISLNQASGPSATMDSRLGVAQEVAQLYKQVLSVANRRHGDTFLFSGFKTLTQPYSSEGNYHGDLGEIPLEVQKGVFVNINIPGPQLFQVKKFNPELIPQVMLGEEQNSIQGAASEYEGRKPAGEWVPNETIDMFNTFETLRVGLLTNDTHTIRGTLESLDLLIQNSISLRSKIGARVMGIDSSLASTDRSNLQNAVTASNLEDADYAEVWATLAKEETVMRASLQAAQKLIQPTLLDFIK